MAKRELRKITVAGAMFVWNADWTYIKVGEESYSFRRTIHLHIRGATNRSQPLYVDLCGPIGDDHAYVLPRQVRAVIEYGLAHGWDPTTQGGPFWLTGADTPVLDGLVITERGMSGIPRRSSGEE